MAFGAMVVGRGKVGTTGLGRRVCDGLTLDPEEKRGQRVGEVGIKA